MTTQEILTAVTNAIENGQAIHVKRDNTITLAPSGHGFVSWTMKDADMMKLVQAICANRNYTPTILNDEGEELDNVAPEVFAMAIIETFAKNELKAFENKQAEAVKQAHIEANKTEITFNQV